MFGFLFNVLKIILLITLPFVLLIRGSVFMHTQYNSHPWISVLAGALMTAVLLFIYFTWFYGKLTGKIGSFSGLKKRFALAMVFVIGLATQGLMFISANNIKHKSLKKEFTSLHPILRLSISTLLIVDRKAVMTDAERQPEDYSKMGLKTNQRSLHYPQKDGYVYAVDLRTNGRSAFRNFILELYFKMMGLKTLRHVGTADHLHVSLYSKYRPGSR